MAAHTNCRVRSAVFITFSGNCKKALTFYQTCFGGILHFVPFEGNLDPYKEIPIIVGSLLADDVVIYGSDLVHNEGRILGNNISIFTLRKNTIERNSLIKKLTRDEMKAAEKYQDEHLLEITDAFDVRWVLGISEH